MYVHLLYRPIKKHSLQVLGGACVGVLGPKTIDQARCSYHECGILADARTCDQRYVTKRSNDGRW